MKSEDIAKKGEQVASKVKEKAGEAVDAGKKGVENAKHEAKDWGSRFEETGRRAADGAQQVVGSVQDARTQLTAILQEQAQERPYHALGAAVALGFVLAGGLTIGIGSKLISIGSRLAMGAAAKRLFG